LPSRVPDAIDSTICRIVNDIKLTRNIQDYVQKMKPIAVALDRVQKSGTMIAEYVDIWHQLGTDLKNQPKAVLKEFNKRMAMAIGPHHYLANMLDHRFQGKSLSDSQKSEAYEYLGSVNADLIPFVLALQSGDGGGIFPKYLFRDTFLRVSPMTWWNVATQSISMADENLQTTARKQLLSVCSQLFTAVASAAGLEHIFF